MHRLYLGVDVSKDRLDVFPPQRGASQIDNAASTIRSFVRSARREGLWVVFEATGGYDRALSALAPAKLDALSRARRAQSKVDSALRENAERDVERKRYAAALAQRQYDRVDPDNMSTAKAAIFGETCTPCNPRLPVDLSASLPTRPSRPKIPRRGPINAENAASPARAVLPRSAPGRAGSDGPR